MSESETRLILYLTLLFTATGPWITRVAALLRRRRRQHEREPEWSRYGRTVIISSLMLSALAMVLYAEPISAGSPAYPLVMSPAAIAALVTIALARVPRISFRVLIGAIATASVVLLAALAVSPSAGSSRRWISFAGHEVYSGHVIVLAAIMMAVMLLDFGRHRPTIYVVCRVIALYLITVVSGVVMWRFDELRLLPALLLCMGSVFYVGYRRRKFPRVTLLLPLGAVYALQYHLHMVVLIAVRRFAEFSSARPDDYDGAGFTLRRAWSFINSGGLFGKGINGDAPTLPGGGRETALALASYRFGFFGAMLIVLNVALLIWCCVRLAVSARSGASAALGGALACFFATETFLHIGAVAGLIPFAGAELPFVMQSPSGLLLHAILAGALARSFGVEARLAPVGQFSDQPVTDGRGYVIFWLRALSLSAQRLIATMVRVRRPSTASGGTSR